MAGSLGQDRKNGRGWAKESEAEQVIAWERASGNRQGREIEEEPGPENEEEPALANEKEMYPGPAKPPRPESEAESGSEKEP